MVQIFLDRRAAREVGCQSETEAVMTINAYWDLLNGLLTRSGHKPADYASASHHYISGATIAEACAKISAARA